MTQWCSAFPARTYGPGPTAAPNTVRSSRSTAAGSASVCGATRARISPATPWSAAGFSSGQRTVGTHSSSMTLLLEVALAFTRPPPGLAALTPDAAPLRRGATAPVGCRGRAPERDRGRAGGAPHRRPHRPSAPTGRPRGTGTPTGRRTRKPVAECGERRRCDGRARPRHSTAVQFSTDSPPDEAPPTPIRAGLRCVSGRGPARAGTRPPRRGGRTTRRGGAGSRPLRISEARLAVRYRARRSSSLCRRLACGAPARGSR